MAGWILDNMLWVGVAVAGLIVGAKILIFRALRRSSEGREE